MLGATLALSGKTDEAVRVLADRAEQADCGPAVLLTLVRVMLEGGASPGQCRRYVERAVAVDVHNETALGMLSHLARELGGGDGRPLERIWAESNGSAFMARALDGVDELRAGGPREAVRERFAQALEAAPAERRHEVMTVVINACADAGIKSKNPWALGLALAVLRDKFPPAYAVVPVGVSLAKVALHERKHEMADEILSIILQQPKEHQAPHETEIKDLLRSISPD